MILMFFKERCQDSPSYNKLLLIFFMFCSNQLVHSTFSAHCTRTAQSGLLTSRYENAIYKCNASILVANTYIIFIWYCQLVAISETFQEGVLVSLCLLCNKRVLSLQFCHGQCHWWFHHCCCNRMLPFFCQFLLIIGVLEKECCHILRSIVTCRGKPLGRPHYNWQRLS